MSRRHDAVILVDEFLADVRHLSLIDGDRVRDFVLDLRILLAASGERLSLAPSLHDANGDGAM